MQGASPTLSHFANGCACRHSERHQDERSHEARSVHSHLTDDDDTVTGLNQPSDDGGCFEEDILCVDVVEIIPLDVVHLDPHRLTDAWDTLWWTDTSRHADVDVKGFTERFSRAHVELFVDFGVGSSLLHILDITRLSHRWFSSFPIPGANGMSRVYT